MAVISVVGTPTWNTTAGNKTVTAAPVAGSLIVVVASSSGLAGGTTSVTDDQTGGTYTQVDADRTGFSTTGVLTVWVRNGLIPTSASTVFTANQAASTGGGLAVFSVTGMVNVGASAVRSNGGQSTGTAGTTPAPVLSNAPLFSNPVITAVSNGTNGGGTTNRANYDDVAIGGYNTPATGLDICYQDFGETTATITWGGTSATAFASFAIELDAPPPIYASIQFLTTPTDRVRRAPHYRLQPPAVVDQPEAEPLARPVAITMRAGMSAPRLFSAWRSRLYAPVVVDQPFIPAPDEVLPENLAPVIGGYGAM